MKKYFFLLTVTLTSIPRILFYNISKIDPLNLLETVLDVKSDALIFLYNLAECSNVFTQKIKKCYDHQ
jgi:hypothetical protein